MSDVWESLTYFSREENWGDPDKMDPDLLIRLDHFRGAINHPFYLLNAYSNDGHSENSYHYKGRAVDGRFIDQKTGKSLTLKEHLLIAIRAPFGGVGLYTWGAGGPFLHLDNRTETPDRKFWVSKKSGVYENISLAFIREVLAS